MLFYVQKQTWICLFSLLFRFDNFRSNLILAKKMTIWLQTCFWTWNSRKSKKLRALLKVGHFQDSKFRIWLKHPGLPLVSFYAAGPFDFLRKRDQFWTNILFVQEVFLGQITTNNLSLCSWETSKKSFRRKWLRIFHFSTLWIWLFGHLMTFKNLLSTCASNGSLIEW